MTALAELHGRLAGELAVAGWAGFLVFMRVGAAMAMLPLFGDQAVPVRVRLVLALAFAAVVAPAVAGDMPRPGTGLPVVAVLAEAATGLAIGFGFRLFVIALTTAGTIAAQSVSLAQIFGGAGPEPQPAIAQVLMLGGLALAAGMGLHVRVAEAFVQSYAVLPAGRFPDAAVMAGWGLAGVVRAFGLAFSLAMPFVIGALLYNLALGAINRAMPTLMVAFVGAPALTLLGLAGLAVVAPAVLVVWRAALTGFLDDPFAVTP
jgi:flagellar biosynthetic protein FliR